MTSSASMVCIGRVMDAVDKKLFPQAGEFTVVAAFVAVFDGSSSSTTNLPATSVDDEKDAIVLSLATGTKCIAVRKPADDLNGCLLHDSHAEVLAKRGLQRFLFKSLLHYQQNPSIVNSKSFLFEVSPTHTNKLQLKTGWKIHLHVSDSLCGDASIYACPLLPSNHRFTGSKTVGWSREEESQAVGQVRVKSGRSDISPDNRTTSKSCTDKVCKWIAVGLQGSLLTNFFEMVALSRVVVSQDPFTSKEVQLAALARGLTSRLNCCVAVDVNDGNNEHWRGLGKCVCQFQNTQQEKQQANNNNNEDEEDESVSDSKRRKVQHHHQAQAEEVRPCGQSINWVKDVVGVVNAVGVAAVVAAVVALSNNGLDGSACNSDGIESLQKHIRRGVSGGSVEALQAHSGAVIGVTKKNMSSAKFSSRLCRQNMSFLLHQALHNNNNNNNNNAIQSYGWWKEVNAEYRERVQQFLSLPGFQSWNQTSSSSEHSEENENSDEEKRKLVAFPLLSSYNNNNSSSVITAAAPHL